MKVSSSGARGKSRLRDSCVGYSSMGSTSLPELQSLELDPVGVHLGKVVMRLLREPALSAAAEHFGQAHCHLGRNPALFVHQL